MHLLVTIYSLQKDHKGQAGVMSFVCSLNKRKSSFLEFRKKKKKKSSKFNIKPKFISYNNNSSNSLLIPILHLCSSY